MEDRQTSSAENANLKVMVRLRPPDATEASDDMILIPPDNPCSITLRDPLSRGRSEHFFEFNRVFSWEAPQSDVFEEVCQPLVDHALNGFNSCCFAYGQTGSGKTYSIFGEGGPSRGILPRAVEHLYEKLQTRAPHKDISVVVSFLEIYLDQVRDLGKAYLDNLGVPPSERTLYTNSVPAGVNASRPSSVSSRPASAGGQSRTSRPSSALGGRDKGGPPDAYEVENLEIHEAPNGQVYVKNLSLIPVNSIADVMQVIYQGVQLRETHETKMNAVSSRSHTVFTMTIVQRDKHGTGETVSGMLNLVDLAGSERIAKSQSEGQRFQEAVIINSSLTALGKVVLSLAADPKNVKHIPYRDSKLTRILQNSLGGNSYTTLLATLNPSPVHYEECLNSLQFADRCKNIENKPRVNYIDTQQQNQDKRVKRLLQEIAELKETIASNKSTYEKKMKEITEHLGVDGGVNGLMKLLEGSKDLALVNQAKDARKALTTVADRNRALEDKVNEYRLLFEKSQRLSMDSREKHQRELIRLREESTLLKEELSRSKQEVVNLKKTETQLRTQELKTVTTTNSEMLKAQFEFIKDLPNSLKVRGETVDRYTSLRDLSREEAEELFNGKYRSLVASHKQELDNLKAQYEFWFKQKTEDTNRFVTQFKEYKTRKSEECRQLKQEILWIYDLLKRYANLVENIEKGRYEIHERSGIKFVPIPTQDKPILPDSDHFRKLFKTLESTSRQLDAFTNRQELSKSQRDLRLPPAAYTDRPVQPLNLPNVDASVDNMLPSELKRYAKDLQQTLKEQVQRLEDGFNGGMSNEEERQKVREQVLNELIAHDTIVYIQTVEAERDRYKQLLTEEVNKAKDLRVALESTKRVVGKLSDDTGVGSRPGSALSVRSQSSMSGRVRPLRRPESAMAQLKSDK
eukprot:GILK01006895.1.p1 GENE.GILK01006895.1~~GILK01006895.1.p1  ORF type:complete len:960 (-),score=159.20 GILK01006895.1:39-2780(-)